MSEFVELAKDYKAKLDCINRVVDEFNAGKVVKAMQALNWCWYNKDEMTEYDIRQEARKLLERVAFDNCNEVSTGGLRAWKQKYDNDECYYLSFEVDQTSSYINGIED